MDKRPRDGQFYMRGDEGACGGGHNGRPLELRPRARAWRRAAPGWFRTPLVIGSFGGIHWRWNSNSFAIKPL